MRQNAELFPLRAPAVDTRGAARFTTTEALTVLAASLNLIWRCSHTLVPIPVVLSPAQEAEGVPSIAADGLAAYMSKSADTDRNDWEMLPPA